MSLINPIVIVTSYRLDFIRSSVNRLVTVLVFTIVYTVSYYPSLFIVLSPTIVHMR